MKRNNLSIRQQFQAAALIASWKDRIEKQKLSFVDVAAELSEQLKATVTDNNVRKIVDSMDFPPNFGRRESGKNAAESRHRLDILEATIHRMKSELGMTW